jgi:hypothetical protein
MERHFPFEQARYEPVTAGLVEREMPTYADYGGWVISTIDRKPIDITGY